MQHPRRKDGSFIRDSINPDVYQKEMMAFQRLERALGKLHNKDGNHVKYRLVQPLLGWASEGTDKGRVTFFDLATKGRMDDLTLYVYTRWWQANDMQRQTELITFFNVVRACVGDAMRFKVVCDEWDVNDMFRI